MSLQKIQERLKAPKSQFNAFGKYNYRNLEDILEALKPLLAEFEYSLIISDEMVEVGGRVYVKATVDLYDDKNEIVAVASACAREAATKKGMDDAQITGAASSYARKYACNGLFCIDDTRDADSQKPENKADKIYGKTDIPETPAEADNDPKPSFFYCKRDKQRTTTELCEKDCGETKTCKEYNKA
jgi:hypothetical protein